MRISCFFVFKNIVLLVVVNQIIILCLDIYKPRRKICMNYYNI